MLVVIVINKQYYLIYEIDLNISLYTGYNKLKDKFPCALCNDQFPFAKLVEIPEVMFA